MLKRNLFYRVERIERVSCRCRHSETLFLVTVRNVVASSALVLRRMKRYMEYEVGELANKSISLYIIIHLTKFDLRFAAN